MIKILIKNFNWALYGKEFFWVVLGQVLLVIGSFFLIKIVTNLVSPDEYGAFSLGLTLALGFNQIVFGPLAGAIFRFHSISVDSKQLRTFFLVAKSLFLKATFYVLIISSILLLTAKILVNNLEYNFIIIIIIFSVLSGIMACLTSIHLSERNRKIIALVQGIDPWLKAGLILLIVYYVGSTKYSLIYGYFLTAFFGTIFLLFFVYKSFANSEKTIIVESKKLKERIVKYGLQNSVFGIFTWFHLSSDKWALQLFSSTEDVGLYAVLFQLGYYPMTLFSGVINQFLTPVFFQKIGKGGKTGILNKVDNINLMVMIATIIISLLLFFTLIFLHEFIFENMVSVNYQQFSYLLPWVFLAAGVNGAGQSLMLPFLYKLKMKSLMNGKILSSIVGVTLNMSGALLWGLNGIVVSLLIFSFFHLFYFYKLVKKIKK